MSSRLDLIQKHLADMNAVERHVLEAVQRQRGNDKVRNHVEVNTVLIEVERVLSEHVDHLKRLSDEYGGETENIIKKAITAAAGIAAGLYDQVREDTITRMLRDDYTALSLVAMSYSAMHGFALAISEQKVADVAVSHLKHVTPLLVEISKLVPALAVQETATDHDGVAVDTSVANDAVQNTQAAWATHVSQSLA